ncbi:MAG TPA: acyl carrier protein [Pyrinomonadaceae bacterium]
MDAEQIRASVRQTVASVANLDLQVVSDDASYKGDLSLDSLTILEIAVDVESQFGIDISDEELSCVQTVGDTVRLIQQHLCGAPA